MSRLWTQKHIEELIEQTAKRLGLMGGSVNKDALLKALVGSQIQFPVGSRYQLCTLTATCKEFIPGSFPQLKWEFKLVIQKSGLLDAAIGDTCFVTMFKDIQLFSGDNGLNLMTQPLAFPARITVTVDGTGQQFVLKNAGLFQFRTDTGTTRPIMNTGDNSLRDYRYDSGSIPADNMTGSWNLFITY